MKRPFPKPTDIEVASFARGVPREVPASYVRFILQHGAVQLDVACVGSGLVWFWELKEVLSLNAGYGFTEFAPRLFGFGSDGANELLAFDLRTLGKTPVGTVSAVGLNSDEFRVVSSSFDDFAKLIGMGSDGRCQVPDGTDAG